MAERGEIKKKWKRNHRVSAEVKIKNERRENQNHESGENQFADFNRKRSGKSDYFILRFHIVKTFANHYNYDINSRGLK